MIKSNKIIIVISTVMIISTSMIYFISIKEPKLVLKKTSFEHLPGWKEADIRPSLQAFLMSCRRLEKNDLNRNRQIVQLSAKDLMPACQAGLNVNPKSNAEIKRFFQTWFTPLQYTLNKPMKGLFTGYYVATLNGSPIKTPKYQVPVYGLPNDLIKADLGLFNPDWKNKTITGRLAGQKFLPYPTRIEIDKGAIQHEAPVVAWTNDKVDRLFLEIEGSGVMNFDNGQRIFLNFAGQNGAKYTPIGRVLIEKGLLTKQAMSMQRIRAFFAAHPEYIDSIISENKSFVFFKIASQASAVGVHEILLTPGYSLAIDPTWVPIGIPVWLHTTQPAAQLEENNKLIRLMIAQDVGGAIRGPVRGDVFWGEGQEAAAIAGKMKNPGTYWLLIPTTIAHELANKNFNYSETKQLKV